jgi:hypothetical protein
MLSTLSEMTIIKWQVRNTVVGLGFHIQTGDHDLQSVYFLQVPVQFYFWK